MNPVVTVAVVGLTLGCFAALRAVGFAVAYGVLGEANLAYGDAVILAVLVAAGVHARTGSAPLTLAVGIATAAALLVIADLVILRPVRRGGDPLNIVIVTIGVALVLRNLATATQGVEDRGFPALFGSGSVRLAATSVDWPLAVAAVVVLVATVAGALLLTRTRWGQAVQAVRLDSFGARLSGVPVGRVITVVYGIAGAVGGLAGMVVAAHVGDASVADGFRFTLIAYAAAAFGGGRSIAWAAAGGLVLGLTGSAVQFAYGQVWSDAAYLGVLILVLLIRPAGLSRAAVGQRV